MYTHLFFKSFNDAPVFLFSDNFVPTVIVLPVPVPVYVPLPMNMYSQYTPEPVGLPLPVCETPLVKLVLL